MEQEMAAAENIMGPEERAELKHSRKADDSRKRPEN